MREVQAIKESLHSIKGAGKSHSMVHNLKGWAESASELVKDTASIIYDNSQYGGSTVGPVIDDEQVNILRARKPKMKPEKDRKLKVNIVDVEIANELYDKHLIRKWKREAKYCFDRGKYREAEDLFENILVEMETKNHKNPSERNKITKLLGTVYYRRGKWKASERLHQQLVTERGDLPDSEAKHKLAETHLMMGYLQSAVRWCKSALWGRIKYLGEGHRLVNESLVLLVHIYEASGELSKMKKCKKRLPDGFQGGLSSNQRN